MAAFSPCTAFLSCTVVRCLASSACSLSLQSQADETRMCPSPTNRPVNFEGPDNDSVAPTDSGTVRLALSSGFTFLRWLTSRLHVPYISAFAFLHFEWTLIPTVLLKNGTCSHQVSANASGN